MKPDFLEIPHIISSIFENILGIFILVAQVCLYLSLTTFYSSSILCCGTDKRDMISYYITHFVFGSARASVLEVPITYTYFILQTDIVASSPEPFRYIRNGIGCLFTRYTRNQKGLYSDWMRNEFGTWLGFSLKELLLGIGEQVF